MKRWVSAAGLIVVALLVQQFAQFPVHNAFTNSLSNWMHVPLFALITGTVMWLRTGRDLWRTIGLVVALAALSEVLQLFTGRQASLIDLARDLLGCAIALLFLRGKDGHLQSGVTRLTLTALTIAVCTLSVPAAFLLAYQEQRQMFPTLYSPGTFSGRLLSEAYTPPGLPAQLTSEHPWTEYSDQQVLYITWADRRWPGFHLQEPVANWQGYDYLIADVFNPQQAPQTFTAGVRHRHFEGTARYHATELRSGHNRIRIPVQHLALLDDGQPATITHLILYTSQKHAGQRIYLGRVWLE